MVFLLSVSRFNRVTTDELTVKDITIPKGMQINCLVFAMHRDPEYWPEPEVFKPERLVTCKSCYTENLGYLGTIFLKLLLLCFYTDFLLSIWQRTSWRPLCRLELETEDAWGRSCPLLASNSGCSNCSRISQSSQLWILQDR